MTSRASRQVRRVVVSALVIAATGCRAEAEPDAYGTFEATEVLVSAETGGQIRQFTPTEGTHLTRGSFVALIDTTQLALERQQIVAQRNAASSRGAEVTEQLGVLEVQREIAQRAYERTRRLHAERAATSQQLDQAEREYRTLVAQIQAVRAQRESVAMEGASTEAKVEQIADRIGKSIIRNPETGTVLTTYARAGELVQPGQPLYKIADLDTLVLRAYLSGAQLSSVRLGQVAQVRIDRGDDLVSIPGIVTWISPTAEFTPTPIQTRDERAELVYAVKIRVPNEGGAIKIGMPGDVTFETANAMEAGPDQS